MVVEKLGVKKLSAKLALSLAIFGMLYVIAIVALFILFELPAKRKEIDRNINQVVDTFVDPAAQAVFNLDEETATTVLSGFHQYNYVERATIKNEDQSTLAEVSYAHEIAPKYVWLIRSLGAKKEKVYYRKLTDPRLSPGVHGNLLVVVNQYQALQEAMGQIRTVLLNNLLQYFLFVIIVYWIVYRVVARRLIEINRALSEISPKSPNNQRVPIDKQQDEITRLAAAINQFIDTAEHYLQDKIEAEKGLLYLTQHLEEVIVERTADLEWEKQNAEKARDEANQANQAKSVFLSNMSHELRTPLNSILGFTQRILKKSADRLNPRELDALERVFDNGKYLLNLVNDILDIAKIEANKMELNTTQVDLGGVLQNCCSRLSALAESKRILLDNTIGPEQVVIEADQQKMEQLFINIIGNAIKYTLEGRISVYVESETETTITVCVEDSGIGINEQDLEKLFDPYNHIHSDLNQAVSVESSGLGLPLSSKIVKLHQGSISVASEPGQGSRFYIKLPKQQSTEEGMNRVRLSGNAGRGL